MSQTVAGGIATVIESRTGLTTFRRTAEEGADLPHVVVIDDISNTRRRLGAGDVVMGGEVQVDVWHRLRDPDTLAVVEDYTLTDRVVKACTGIVLDGPGVPHGVNILTSRAVPDRDPTIGHYVIRLLVERTL